MYKDETTEGVSPLRMPTPTGYRILIAALKVADKTDGGVLLPDSHKDREAVASVVGFVLALGPDAYASKDKFPNGPYCKEGDFVIFRSYSGTRISVEDQEFRIINDDTVEAVVDDPRGYKRV